MMIQEGSTEPKRSVTKADSSIVLTISLLYACPLLAPRILMGFRYVMRGYCGTYVNSKKTIHWQLATLAAPSARTVVLPVQKYWQYREDRGPALAGEGTTMAAKANTVTAAADHY